MKNDEFHGGYTNNNGDVAWIPSYIMGISRWGFLAGVQLGLTPVKPITMVVYMNLQPPTTSQSTIVTIYRLDQIRLDLA